MVADIRSVEVVRKPEWVAHTQSSWETRRGWMPGSGPESGKPAGLVRAWAAGNPCWAEPGKQCEMQAVVWPLAELVPWVSASQA